MADFRYLFELLRDNHPHLPLKARFERYDWVAHEAQFAEWVRASRTDADFAQAIHRILTLVNNGHTGVIYGDYVRFLQTLAPEGYRRALGDTTPEIAQRWFELARGGAPPAQPAAVAAYLDGRYYLVETPSGLLVGAQLLEIRGVPVHEHVRALRGLQILDYDPIHKKLYAVTVNVPPGAVKVQEDGGRPREAWLAEAPLAWRRTFEPGPRYTDQATIFVSTIADGQAGYIHIRSMSHREEDAAALARAVDQVKGMPVLIIDIRGNGGGTDLLWMRGLVDRLIAEPGRTQRGILLRGGDLVMSWGGTGGQSFEQFTEGFGRSVGLALPPEVNAQTYPRGFVSRSEYPVPAGSSRYQGQVFLLTDGRVYSAGEGLALFAQDTGWATIVGAPTGGGGIDLMPVGLSLPHSRLAFNMPLALGIDQRGAIHEYARTMPDVLVTMTIDELIALSVPRPAPDPRHDAVLREALRRAGVRRGE